MSYETTDAFGDTAYIDGALARLETGQPLRDVDLDELSYAIGREAALKLARTVEQDRAKNAARPRRRGGVFGWFFGGPIHTDPDPLSPEVVKLLRRIRSDQLITEGDVINLPGQVARGLGRAGARAAARMAKNHPARVRAARRRTR